MKIIIIVIVASFLSITDACECPTKPGDHVSPISETIFNFHWHCGNVKSVSGKCGKWTVSLRTCDGKQFKCHYSYLKVLNSQKENKDDFRILKQKITSNESN